MINSQFYFSAVYAVFVDTQKDTKIQDLPIQPLHCTAIIAKKGMVSSAAAHEVISQPISSQIGVKYLKPVISCDHLNHTNLS